MAQDNADQAQRHEERHQPDEPRLGQVIEAQAKQRSSARKRALGEHLGLSEPLAHIRTQGDEDAQDAAVQHKRHWRRHHVPDESKGREGALFVCADFFVCRRHAATLTTHVRLSATLAGRGHV